jgi:hypothetical protein
VVEDNTAKWRYVLPGKNNSEFVEILTGVQEGDQVIIDNHFFLSHDQAVRIVQ